MNTDALIMELWKEANQGQRNLILTFALHLLHKKGAAL